MAEVTEVNCKYLLGTCYSCQKCLYCFEFPQQNPCKCNKNKQPTRTKYPKRGQQIYQRSFTPDLSFPTANKYLFDANIKFVYNSNFEKPFSYTFCSTCNSQIQRYRSADKKAQQIQKKENDDNIIALDGSSNEKEVINVNEKKEDPSNEREVDYVNKEDQIFSLVSSDYSEEENGDYDVEEEEDSDLEEIKVQIIVKSKNIKDPTAKTLSIEPVNYNKFIEKINLVVQKTLRKKVMSKDYMISYKAVNVRGPSNELEDELDFQEFISEYGPVQKDLHLKQIANKNNFNMRKNFFFIEIISVFFILFYFYWRITSYMWRRKNLSKQAITPDYMNTTKYRNYIYVGI
ncbi:hypothetical protein RclHR1_01730013 [Rhizophagus clarus]|uniref:Transmembrane protein n=1 Tax=Rhizophagus clarus TaxID=94130 RepID=A0A2Z6QL66_9GLOM|nr:hypothetical protein RclHR1_01730013 [Rhizophagus clarus]